MESGFSNDEINKLPSFTEPSHKVAGLSRKASSFLGVEEFGIKEGLPVFAALLILFLRLLALRL